MIIYNSSVEEFKTLSQNPRLLAERILINLKEKFGINVGESEMRSWISSLPVVADLLKESNFQLTIYIIYITLLFSEQY